MELPSKGSPLAVREPLSDPYQETLAVRYWLDSPIDDVGGVVCTDAGDDVDGDGFVPFGLEVEGARVVEVVGTGLDW